MFKWKEELHESYFKSKASNDWSSLLAKQVKDSELSLQWLWVAAVARVPSPARELPHAMEQQQIKKKKSYKWLILVRKAFWKMRWAESCASCTIQIVKAKEKFWKEIKSATPGVPVVAQWKRIWPVSMRMQVWSLASISGLRIWCCHELWYWC